MWRDVLRFYREAPALLEPGPEIRLDEYLRQGRYSDAFVADHLLPLVGAVWSSNREGALAFPARLLVRFFAQHGFLQRSAGLQWLTIQGGSRAYVSAVHERFRAAVRLSAPVERVERGAGHVEVTTRGAAAERFDHAVVACHADQALALLPRPDETERRVLGAFRFVPNEVVLHTDTRLMPRRRRAWSSWNYHLDDDRTGGASVTYWMNRLQAIAGPTQYFVTLNRTDDIAPDRRIATFSYAHPYFTPEAADAQGRHGELVGRDGVSFCGAYWRNGFHEDGVVSALRVCRWFGEEL